MLLQLKGGAVAHDVDHHTLTYIKEEKLELEKHFVKNIGHGDLEEGGKKYSLQLVNTVQVNTNKAVCLTSGVKLIKDKMFFLNQDVNSDRQSLAPAKKVLATKLNGNALPMKNKTAGRKVFQNKTHSVVQEELIQLMRAKITEHQHELHTCLQMDGLKKYLEGRGGMGRNKGKG
ncbi:hypothetical protein WOLCODRAFT_150624 [Wolfiporia cocos MD-104 SS10]|uniref:Uncharacterized protein n=1 Tax=Wolfiporia cocos (strain MD-104) TaxID=742152 RepID=A0A2H3JV21_WOLCO|nr:hypothetical protein WOLCODRAFT_150624 [Wolfiporia cocos MD-104 SS10]